MQEMTDMQITAETVRPSNRWALKKLQTFPEIYPRARLIRHVLYSILSASISKLWLLKIAHVYHACHVERHFASDKQTRCRYKLPKVTNQRVYQELVYRNEVFKTMLTGSPVAPSFSTRPRSSPATFSIVYTDREPGAGYFLVYVHASCTSMTDFALWISV